MQSNGIYRNLSSATVYSSSRADATLVLFGNFVNFFDMGDYAGNFVQITNRRSSSSALDIDRFADHGINNGAHSMLLVAASKDSDEFRLSFRDIFLDQWRTVIDGQLAGTQARRNGNPSLTWEMWPNNISHLSSNQRYLRIHQRLRIVISAWPDYDASITYHVRLYLDGSGRLRGYVARWAYWVEGGIKSGAIADRLEPQAIAGMSTLNDALETQLGALGGVRFEDLYYLPGRQLTRAPTGVITGTTLEDVTIVLDLA